MALESLDIRVRQQGARTVARDVRNIGFAASAVSGQLSTTSRVLRGLAFASVARRVAAFADSFTNLNNRVRIYSKSIGQANATTAELISIANRTRISTDAVSLTFQRLAINQDRLGLSTERVTRLVELLGKAVASGGSNAQEAGGALRQFSQAISADFKAAAQELNSVLEQTPGLAKALADGLGTTTDQIKVLAREGKLNSDIVIRAIEAQADVIEARFSRIAPTIGQAFQVLTNSLEVFVGTVFRVTDAGKGITDRLIGLSQALLRLATDQDRLNNIIDKTIAAIKVLLTLKILQFLRGYVVAMDAAVASTSRFIALNAGKAFRAVGVGALFARKGIQSIKFASVADEMLVLQGATGKTGGLLQKTFGGLGRILKSPLSIIPLLGRAILGLGRAVLVAFAANPIGILAVALTALGGIIFGLRNETVKLGNDTVKVRDIAVATFQIFVEKVKAVVERIKELGDNLTASVGGLRGFASSFIAVFTTIGRLIGEVFGALAADALAAFDIVGKGFSNVGNALTALQSGDVAGAFKALFAPIPGEFESAFKSIDVGKVVREEFSRDFLQEIASTFEGTDIGKRAKELAAARRKAEEEAAKAAGEPGALPEGTSVGGATFRLLTEQKVITTLVGKFDIATKAAFKFLKVHDSLQKAVDKNIISEKERTALIQNLGQDSFRRLAAGTDEVASLTIDYADAIAELTAAAKAGDIGSDEFTAALGRQEEQFRKAQLELKSFQETLSTTDSFIKGAQAGFDDFTESLGTAFSNIREAVSGALDEGLKAIDEFVRTGEFNFAEFSRNIIAEIQKVITRLLLIQTIRAFEKTSAEGGSFFGNLLGGRIRGDETGGPGAASTETGATTGIRGIISDILGGGRQGALPGGQQAPAGTPADPIFTAIADPSIVALKENNTDVVEQLVTGNQSAAERATAQTEQQASLFESLKESLGGVAEKIGGFFSTVGTSISGVFSGGLNAVKGILGIGQDKNAESLTGILDTNKEGFGGLGGLLSQLGGAAGGLGGLLGGLFGGGGGGSGEGGGGGLGGIVSIASSLFSIFGGGLQGGGVLGPSALGQAFLTGEVGPELFVPRQTGTVIPSDILAGMGGGTPQVNLQIVNNDDPKAVPEAMSTREGEQVILNTIQRNRGRLKEIIA